MKGLSNPVWKRTQLSARVCSESCRLVEQSAGQNPCFARLTAMLEQGDAAGTKETGGKRWVDAVFEQLAQEQHKANEAFVVLVLQAEVALGAVASLV